MNAAASPQEPEDLARRADRLERALVQAEGEVGRLRDQLRERGEFLQNLAHELATPLTPLVGYLKLLSAARLGPLTDRQAQVLEAMAHATERLGRSIDNLSDFAALETGHYRVIKTEFDAVAMVEAVVGEFHSKAKGKHVRIDVRHPERLPLSGDERKVRQALANVLDNALRFSPHGGHVLIDASERDGRVQVAVYDQGPGLPPDAQRLVDPHQRKPDERAGGPGLGLPVVRQIVDAHGGGLFLESPPKEQPDDVRDLYPGSKVGFWLPREGFAPHAP